MAGKELGAQGRGVSSAKNSESCVYNCTLCALSALAHKNLICLFAGLHKVVKTDIFSETDFKQEPKRIGLGGKVVLL